jgi:hypothetical protein
MKRLANWLILAAAGLASCGCISPVVVKSIGPAASTSPIDAEPAQIAFQRLPDETARSPAEEIPTLRRAKPLSEISLDITARPTGQDELSAIAPPRDYAGEALPALAQEQPFTRGDLVEAGFEWHPSPEGLTFCHQPLYFEDVNLERYGRSWGVLQPAVSVAKFYGRIPALPYMVFAQPARRCTDHAHWSLPGYRIPVREHQPLVPSVHGGAAEVAVLYGLILLVP